MSDTHTTPATPVTLDDIRAQKEVLRGQMKQQRTTIHNRVSDIFAPVPSTNKWEQMMGLVNNGLAVYDGMMMGLRIMQRIRHTFRR